MFHMFVSVASCNHWRVQENPRTPFLIWFNVSVFVDFTVGRLFCLNHSLEIKDDVRNNSLETGGY